MQSFKDKIHIFNCLVKIEEGCGTYIWVISHIDASHRHGTDNEHDGCMVRKAGSEEGGVDQVALVRQT